MGGSSRVPSSKASQQRCHVNNKHNRVNNSNKSKLNTLSVKHNKPIRMKGSHKQKNPQSISKTSKVDRGKSWVKTHSG